MIQKHYKNTRYQQHIYLKFPIKDLCIIHNFILLYSQIVETQTCRQNGRNEAKGEKSYLLWRHFLPFSLRWTICQQFIAKIHEHSRAYHISSSHVRISGRKCYYKKNPVKHISGILESKGLKLESTIITRCFSPAEEKMLAWHSKENHYNHIYIKKRCGGI